MQRKHPDGFVLVAVIWFIALVALVAAIVGNWVSGSLQGFAALQDRVVAESELMSATNQVAYLMVSNYFSSRGLEVLSGDDLKEANTPKTLMLEVRLPTRSPFIALDGRPYRFGSGIIELQDNKGLYNLNDVAGYTLERVLDLYGVPRDKREGLYDKLMDYQNKGPYNRLNGANRDEYVRAGRAPPRNAPILTPWEPLRILGWDSEAVLWTGDQPFWDMATVSQSHGINPNTASAMVLRTLPGLDDSSVAKLIEYRAKRQIGNLYHMQEITGRQIPISPVLISPFPANNLRLKAAFRTDPLEHIVVVSLTPTAEAPYRIEYVVELPKTKDVQTALTAADLPGFPGLAQIP
jgi:hypothetical protein